MKAFWRKPQRPPKIDLSIKGELKIKMEKPPCYDNVCGAFGIKPAAYFTYGDTIYLVDVPFPPPEIVEHERIHMEQQLAFLPPERRVKGNENEGAALWWGQYLRDPAFRLDQEARAYGRQYAVIAPHVKDRNARFNYLRTLGTSLSGPLYNNIIGLGEAMNLIKTHSGIK